jgi:hypothetical protein
VVRYGAGVGRWPVARLVEASFKMSDLTCCDDGYYGGLDQNWATWIATLNAASVLRQKN